MRHKWLVTMVSVVIALATGGLLVSGPVLAQGEGRPFIGIRFGESEDGMLVVEVLPGTAAEAAGIQVDDLITTFDGEPITSGAALTAMMSQHSPGDTVTLGIQRAGESLELEVTLGTEPDDLPTPSPAEPVPALTRFVAIGGATFADTPEGWVVDEVEPDSPAEAGGLLPGDRVIMINGEAVDDFSLGDLARLAASGGNVPLEVLREGETIELTITIEAGANFRSYRAVRPDMPHAGIEIAPGQPPQPGPFITPNRAFLGVTFSMLNTDLLTSLAEDASVPFAVPTVEEGAIIFEVAPDTPAAEAGLEPGDVITAVDGDVVDEERTLADRIYAYEPGDTIELTVVRGEETLTLPATLTTPPSSKQGPGFGQNFIIPGGGQERQPFSFILPPGTNLEEFLENHPDWQELFEQFEEGGFSFQFPEGHFFTDPGFDWQQFLEENPDFGALLEALRSSVAPDQLENMFPNFPWFGDFDPFHEGTSPIPDQPEVAA